MGFLGLSFRSTPQAKTLNPQTFNRSLGFVFFWTACRIVGRLVPLDSSGRREAQERRVHSRQDLSAAGIRNFGL